MNNLETYTIRMPHSQRVIIIGPDNFTIESEDSNQISGYVKIKENIIIDDFEIEGVYYGNEVSIDFIWHSYVTFSKDEDGRTIGKLTKNELTEIKLIKYYGTESIDEEKFVEAIRAEYESDGFCVGDFILV